MFIHRTRARPHAAQILSAQANLRTWGRPAKTKGPYFGCRNPRVITPKACLVPRSSMDPPRAMATAASDRFQFRIYLSMKYCAKGAKTA